MGASFFYLSALLLLPISSFATHLQFEKKLSCLKELKGFESTTATHLVREARSDLNQCRNQLRVGTNFSDLMQKTATAFDAEYDRNNEIDAISIPGVKRVTSEIGGETIHVYGVYIYKESQTQFVPIHVIEQEFADKIYLPKSYKPSQYIKPYRRGSAQTPVINAFIPDSNATEANPVGYHLQLSSDICEPSVTKLQRYNNITERVKHPPLRSQFEHESSSWDYLTQMLENAIHKIPERYVQKVQRYFTDNHGKPNPSRFTNTQQTKVRLLQGKIIRQLRKIHHECSGINKTLDEKIQSSLQQLLQINWTNLEALKGVTLPANFQSMTLSIDPGVATLPTETIKPTHTEEATE